MELELAMTSQQAAKTVAVLETQDVYVENADNCRCTSDASGGWEPALANERADRRRSC